MNAIRNSYYLLFYAIFRFGVGGTSREYKKWGALLVMGVVQILLVAIADLWLEMATGENHFLGLPRTVIAIIVFVMFYLNYLVLLSRNQWEVYETRFLQYPSRGRRVRIAAALSFVALVVAMLFYSFHRFGEWKGGM